MTAIAILALIGFVLGIVHDVKREDDAPRARMALSAIMIISWWNISFVTAIVLLVLASIWSLTVILYMVNYQEL